MTPQPPVRVLVAAVGVACAALLTGCGSGSSPSGDVTVTVTPTVTASEPSQTPTKSPSDSDVKGRNYDYGVVTKVSDVEGTTVLELDRWTWKGLDDTKLAKRGIPVKPFTGAVPYENQNAKLTYTIPVADDARILFHHCGAADQPLQSKSVDAKGLTGLAERENTVLVKLDDAGRLVEADNIPGCP